MWLNGICFKVLPYTSNFCSIKKNTLHNVGNPQMLTQHWVNEWMGGKANLAKANVFLTAIFLLPLLSLKIRCPHFRYRHNSIMFSLVSDCIWEPVLGVWGTNCILSVIQKNFYLNWKKTSCLQCQNRCCKIVGKKGKKLPSLRLHLVMPKM